MEDEILETVDDRYHDAENDVDPEDDSERSFTGTLSESSDHEESDLYDYKVCFSYCYSFKVVLVGGCCFMDSVAEHYNRLFLHESLEIFALKFQI